MIRNLPHWVPYIPDNVYSWPSGETKHVQFIGKIARQTFPNLQYLIGTGRTEYNSEKLHGVLDESFVLVKMLEFHFIQAGYSIF